MASSDGACHVDVQTAAPRLQCCRGADGYARRTSEPKELLTDGRVIPPFHLPAQFAVSPDVRDRSVHAEGRLQLENVWLGKDRP